MTTLLIIALCLIFVPLVYIIWRGAESGILTPLFATVLVVCASSAMVFTVNALLDDEPSVEKTWKKLNQPK